MKKCPKCGLPMRYHYPPCVWFGCKNTAKYGHTETVDNYCYTHKMQAIKEAGGDSGFYECSPDCELAKEIYEKEKKKR